MYIRKFNVRNYMIHKDTNLSLTPITVLVGPNGGGKSALFDAMLNFSMVSRGSITQAFGPFPFSYKSTLWNGAKGVDGRMHYDVELSSAEDSQGYLKYEIAYAQNGVEFSRPAYTIFTERLTKMQSNEILFDRSRPSDYPAFNNILKEYDKSIFAALRQEQIAGNEIVGVEETVLEFSTQISRFNRFKLDSSVLAQPSRLPDFSDQETNSPPPRIGYRGEDLAGTLYYLSQTQSPTLEKIKEKIRAIDENFDDFEFNVLGTDRIGFSATYSDSRQIVPSVRLSSGTLNYIGLIVLVTSITRSPLLMIEEPENGLTPQAVKSFYQTVRELAENDDLDKRSQVLISSHSPFVICEAWNGEDRDFIHRVKVDNGASLIRKFSNVVEEQKIVLGKKNGERVHLSLANAEEIMSGYLS